MKKKSFVVIVIILILIIIGLCAYIAYDKGVFGNKENNTNNTVETSKKEQNEDTEEILDVNSEQVNSLINQIIESTNSIYTSGSKYFGYYYQKNELKADNVDNDIILYTALKKFINDENITSTDYNSINISKDEIAPLIKKIFGDVKYENKTIKITACDPGTFIYDNNTGLYTVELHGCGGAGTSVINHKITDAVKKNDRIEITIAIVYATCGYEQQSADIPGKDYCTFGTSVDENKKLVDSAVLLKTENNGNDINSLFSFDTYIDKLNKYKFTFTKDDNDNYVFTKVEKK